MGALSLLLATAAAASLTPLQKAQLMVVTTERPRRGRRFAMYAALVAVGGTVGVAAYIGSRREGDLGAPGAGRRRVAGRRAAARRRGQLTDPMLPACRTAMVFAPGAAAGPLTTEGFR